MGWAFLIALLSLASQVSAAETLEVLIQGKKWDMPLIVMRGHQYVSLDEASRLTQATYKSLPGRSVQVVIGGSSFLLKEGSLKVAGKQGGASLAAPPIRLASGWFIPVDLFSFFLQHRHHQGVWWDKDRRQVRVGLPPYSVTNLRYRSYSDYTRLVIELTKPLEYSWTETGNRGFLWLQEGILSPEIKEKAIDDGLIGKIRARQSDDLCVVEVSVLASHREVRTFKLKNPDRIVIDVYRGDARREAEASPPRKEAGTLMAAENKIPASAAPVARARLVIDPGHGGGDSGAVGPTGLREKDVVLDIGMRLRDLVEKRLGVEVILTRQDDTFVPLRERAALANVAKADFFISIHANASLRGRAEGFETFFLSPEASDSEARDAALRENGAADLEGVQSSSGESLKMILWDMAQNEYISESSRLAETVQNELDKIQKIANRGVKTAPFYVLMGAAMPAVLVEVAFISNPEGERNLGDEAYRETIAEALFRAVSEFKGYFEKKMGMERKPRSG